MNDRTLITLLFLMSFDPFTYGVIALCGVLALVKRLSP